MMMQQPCHRPVTTLLQLLHAAILWGLNTLSMCFIMYSLSTGYEVKYEVICSTTVTSQVHIWQRSTDFGSSVTEGGTLLPDMC